MLRAQPRLAGRLGAPQLQTVRYLLAGGSMSLLYAALVWAIHGAGLYGWASSLIASVVVVGPTALLHRYFTFGVEGSLLSQAAGTAALAASNVPLGAVAIFILVDVLEWNAFVSGLVATAAVSVLNYLVFSRLVFRRPAA